MKTSRIPPILSKKTRIVNVIFAQLILFFLLTHNAFGQIKVRKSYPNKGDTTITRVERLETLFFHVLIDGRADTIYVGTSVDNYGNGEYFYAIYVFFPKGSKVTNSQLEMGFDKQGLETFEPSYTDTATAFVEYKVTKEQFLKLKKYNYEYINFRNEHIDCPFLRNKGEYFSSFYKTL